MEKNSGGHQNFCFFKKNVCFKNFGRKIKKIGTEVGTDLKQSYSSSLTNDLFRREYEN